jgi:formylglycine-generating enzyme required for sulfatase activity
MTGKDYRLPSEAEWEYAARAGTTTPFSTGACITTDQANYRGFYGYGDCQKSGADRGKTLEVGSFNPNPWGLYDVHGNLWEWVQDCWHDSYSDAPPDGSAWGSRDCAIPMLRGGSWSSGPEKARSASRISDESDHRFWTFGFRVARTY